jgi:L-malate glycosyltransferase
MKILYITPFNGIHGLRWIKFFADAGHEVHAVNVGLEVDEVPKNIIIHELKVPQSGRWILNLYRRYFAIKKQLSKILLEVQPELVHVHGISAYVYLARKFGNAPIVATSWGSEVLIEPNESIKNRLVVKKALKSADIVTCDAIHITDRMVELGAERKRIRTIYFGSDFTAFNPQKRDSQLCEELKFKPGTKLIISLRQLKPVYNIETFIWAIPVIRKKFANVGFVIASSGPESTMLSNLAKQLDVHECVRFTGRLSDEDMQRYVASSDVYVSTALSDAGLASSTSEAMASGVPVVITDFGNNSEWVKEGETGYLFKTKDYKTLASKIIDMLNNPSQTHQIAQKGMEYIKENNNWHVEMQKVEVLYQQLILESK